MRVSQNICSGAGMTAKTVLLDGNSLTRDQLVAVARHGVSVALDQSQLVRVQRAADFLADKVSCGEPTYGVTTGFGSNADKLLGAHRLRDELPGGHPDKPEGTLLEELQHNLIITHAVSRLPPMWCAPCW
jgi:histidine ammonia-lyase